MRRLPPTLRLKRRYLLVRGEKNEIEKALIDYLGILGWARAAPLFSNHSGGLVVVVNREELINVRAAFALSNVSVVKVSGTLKGIK
jgi:RNase P/RNase MRP subunit POP5